MGQISHAAALSFRLRLPLAVTTTTTTRLRISSTTTSSSSTHHPLTIPYRSTHFTTSPTSATKATSQLNSFSPPHSLTAVNTTNSVTFSPNSPHLQTSSFSTTTIDDVGATTAGTTALQPLDFNDTKASFETRTTLELIRAFLVFKVSSYPLFVKNSRALLSLSETVLGKKFTSFLLKQTFFGHFCGGETSQDVISLVDKLKQNGIGAILDYAAEGGVTDAPASSSAEYEDREYENNKNLILSSIQTGVKTKKSIVAMKVTALINPDFLEQVSTYLNSPAFKALGDENQVESEDQLTPKGLPAHLLPEAKKLSQRLHQIAKEASDKQTRVMVDAEQTYYQTAIHHYVTHLQQQYNREIPIIHNTYQAYLRDSFEKVSSDLTTSLKKNYIFAAKIVRGAYMYQERERAKQLNLSDPIHPNIAATHENYDHIVQHILCSLQPTELMVASHNENSISKVTTLLQTASPEKKDSVLFGQLFGMCDYISFTLGRNHFSVYKYLPYGPVREVIPYLVRRAEENSDLLERSQKERALLSTEIKRRLFSL